jgi:hypothetical protein
MKLTYIKSDPNTESSSEKGAILFMLAFGLGTVLIGFLAFSIGMAELHSTRSRLQEIVDHAAHAGAATFCSTRECFDDAYELALRSIENEILESDLAGGHTFSLARNAGPIWTPTPGITVEVQRGYWWPVPLESVDIPTSNVTLHANNQFEPIDRPSADPDWQAENKMRPQHVVANALYIRIQRAHALDALSVFGVFSTQQEVSVYAVAGDRQGGEVCAAPFAVHICSLLDSQGDINYEQASEYERYFTSIHRYCAEGDPYCNVIPGTLWTPVIDEERRNRRNGLSSDIGNSRNVPTGVSTFPQRYSCSYEPLGSTRIYPDGISDQFGIVGLPGPSGTATESDILEVLASAPDLTASIQTPGGCAATTIGSRFDILENGLTTAAAEDVIWQQINDSTEDGYNHPEYLDTFLLYGVPTNKAQQDTGWFFNNISPNTRARLCDEYTDPVVGACNSRVVQMYRKCIEDVYDGLLGWDCSNVGSWPGVLDSEFVSACPPQVLDENGNAQNDPSFYRAITNTFTGYDWKSYFNESLDGPNPSVARTSPKIWRIPISVIAPMQPSDDAESYADYCQGIAGHVGQDPAIDPELDYYVIGFVEALFYDTDIGRDSFDPVDLAWICPTSVFDFYTEFAPWGFSGGQGAFANRCNMVKGVINRKNGLLTGSTEQVQALGRKNVTLITQ